MSEWLTSVPEVMVYVFVALMLAGQSLGLPLPGTIAITSAALLAAQGQTNPWLVATAAALGTAIGHSAGYAVGRRGGEPVLDRLNGRAPQAKSLQLITRARSAFARWGTWIVLFGRFSAVLRMYSGPIAGVSRMPHGKFLAASVTGAVLWAGLTTYIVYSLGALAGPWLDNLALVGLAAITALLVVQLVRYVARADMSICVVGLLSGRRICRAQS